MSERRAGEASYHIRQTTRYPNHISVVLGCNNMLDFWIFILFYFVITHETPLDVEQAAACGSPGEEDDHHVPGTA